MSYLDDMFAGGSYIDEYLRNSVSGQAPSGPPQPSTPAAYPPHIPGELPRSYSGQPYWPSEPFSGYHGQPAKNMMSDPCGCAGGGSGGCKCAEGASYMLLAFFMLFVVCAISLKYCYSMFHEIRKIKKHLKVKN